MKDTILAIAGRPGLYRLVSQGRNMLIVETIDEKRRRFPAGVRDRVTSLNDVSMYTEGEDRPLMDVFEAIKLKEGGKPTELDFHKATHEQLADFMAAVLPDYDRTRVYDTDIKKLIQWYNILITNGYDQFSDKNAEDADAVAASEADA